MRALVTGGSGMLGSRIARQLHDLGHKVRVSYRPGDGLRALGDLPAEHAPADLLDEEATARALDGVEVVFHTAALITFRPDLYERQMTVTVEGTRLLLAAAARAGVRRLVHTSTVNTLGIPSPGTVGDEGTPFNWGPWHIGYMDSKRAAEELVLSCDEIETVAVLPGTFFGPGDVNINAGSYIRLVARAPLVLAAPPGGHTVAHVDDVAAGHLLALERGVSGERYVLGGEPMSFRAMFESIARALGRRRRILDLPESVMRAAGSVGDWLGQRGLPLPLTGGLVTAACSKLYYSSSRAQRELGWSFRAAEEAIVDAVEWYRREGLV